MKAAGYLRISKEDQSHHSLESQERVIREYCVRNKLELKAVFTDNGKSSYTFDRPDYKSLEAFLKKNKDVQYLVFMDHSRFSRNTAEALMKLRELELKMKIKVYATTDIFGTDFSDPTAFIMRTLQYVMGESELHNIRKRTRAGILQGKLSGRFMSYAPYGYKNARDKEDKPVIEIYEPKAKIVRFIYKEFLAGMSVTEIGRQARIMGFKQNGKSAITRILANAIYCGLINIPAAGARPSRFVQGIHAPVISEIDYWLIQERLVKKPKIMPKNDQVPLRGVLRCWCGRKMTAGNSKSKTGEYHWYYLCMTHKQNLPAKKLHKQWNDILNLLSPGPEKLEEVRNRLTTQIEQKMALQKASTRELSRDLQNINLQIKRAETKYLTGAQVSEETYREVMVGLRAEQSRILQELEKANTFGPAYFQRLNEFIPILENIRLAFGTMPLEKQQRFIELGFDNGLSYAEGSYRTHFLHPALSHNLLLLNEKGLLIMQKPVKKIGISPTRVDDGADIELSSFLALMELIA